jgi:hypothetical protein
LGSASTGPDAGRRGRCSAISVCAAIGSTKSAGGIR